MSTPIDFKEMAASLKSYCVPEEEATRSQLIEAMTMSEADMEALDRETRVSVEARRHQGALYVIKTLIDIAKNGEEDMSRVSRKGYLNDAEIYADEFGRHLACCKAVNGGIDEPIRWKLEDLGRKLTKVREQIEQNLVEKYGQKWMGRAVGTRE